MGVLERGCAGALAHLLPAGPSGGLLGSPWRPVRLWSCALPLTPAPSELCLLCRASPCTSLIPTRGWCPSVGRIPLFSPFSRAGLSVPRLPTAAWVSPAADVRMSRLWNKSEGVTAGALSLCAPLAGPSLVNFICCCSAERGWKFFSSAFQFEEMPLEGLVSEKDSCSIFFLTPKMKIVLFVFL